MNRLILALGLAPLIVGAGAAAAADPEFGSFWHDGKAELDGYRYMVNRYGEPRRGQCVMVFVTEPFSDSKRVKVDDPSRNPADTFDALKLNLVRDFQTGIYDYNTMASVFTRSADLLPVKISFSSAEWCGHVYEELRVDAHRITERVTSYFEDETSAREIDRPRNGITEDELFIALRGLRGDYLRAGERRSLTLLPGALYRRLTHRPLAWTTATIERLAKPQTVRVPAGTFVAHVYVVRIQGGREGRFEVEREYPHRIVRWAWTAPQGRDPATGWSRPEGNDSGELAGTARLQYWKLHGEGDERYLNMLGLSPMPR